jgi:superfamily I DNA/RNA helicase
VQATQEQLEAVAAATAGGSLAIEALAGTGKTTTLTLIAQAKAAPTLYVAFNKAVVDDARRKFPGHVECRTAHSLAFRAVGHRYQHRIQAPRLSHQQLAERLGCADVTTVLGSDRVVDGRGVAAAAWRAALRFAKTADDDLTTAHVERPAGLTSAAHAQLASLVLPYARRVWADLVDINGVLQFTHDVYLKLWQLQRPALRTERILFDEAQDADPVMLDVVEHQADAQRIYVGDRNQAIYEWRGAVNAMADVEVGERTWLTQSFRFGPAIAEVANEYLQRLGSARLLRGSGSRPSRVGPVERPVAFLARTNAGAMKHVLAELEQRRRPALVGAREEMKAFAEAALKLQAGHRTAHPQLSCFASWAAVRAFVDDAPQEETGEVGMLVRLVDHVGANELIRAVDACVDEAHASVVVSTAHRAKGREWATVKVAPDFPPEGQDADELRLCYVTVTRARDVLDVTQMQRHAPPIDDGMDDRPKGDAASLGDWDALWWRRAHQ